MICEPTTPIEGVTCLRVTLDQQYGGQHALGRFRISVAASRLPSQAIVVPTGIARALGARLVVVRAVSKVDGRDVVEYSEPLPVTVAK